MAAIMVVAAGSTGDVEPFAVLAARLAGGGHEVTLAADAGFEPLAPGGRVEFAPIRADFRSLLPRPGRKRPSVRGEVFPVIRGMLEDSWTVAQSRRPEVIVAHQKTLAAPHLAEKLGIPHVQALTVPMLTPTRAFPLPGMVRRDLGGLLNRASYRLVGLLSRPYAGLIRSWRSDRLTLPPRGRPPAPVSDAVRQAGIRAVIATGWGGLSGVRDAAGVLVIERAPHHWLFPRVAAVVHHGGAGTTAAGLLAARPTVVCPFQGDQYFWGAAVHRAGAGPPPLPAKKLAPERLAPAIRTAIGDPGMQARTAELAERIAQEDGATRAGEQIESTLA
jgi:sterol 3beta-glucosyltransferase